VSLADPVFQPSGIPRLPAGHPFLEVGATGSERYWAVDVHTSALGTVGMAVNFGPHGPGPALLPNASLVFPDPNNGLARAWCVRGPSGPLTR
jgi:hypothetical protein